MFDETIEHVSYENDEMVNVRILECAGQLDLFRRFHTPLPVKGELRLGTRLIVTLLASHLAAGNALCDGPPSHSHRVASRDIGRWERDFRHPLVVSCI